MDIKEISSEAANKLIESGEVSDYEPLGKFWLKEKDKYIGIDNETGDCWVEEFSTKEECFDWLKGGGL